MDILTLELFDVTVSQALTDVNRALELHPDMSVRVLLEGEEMVLHNLLRFLERQERKVTSVPIGTMWQLDIPAMPKAPPPLQPLPAHVLSPASGPRPVIVLRSAFSPGDRALGRNLLLGILRSVESPVPWVGLAHEALEFLDDPMALEVLVSLKERGIPVRISKGSLSFMDKNVEPFEILPDEEWQSLAARGDATIL